MTENRCRHCNHPIVWTETSGWQQTHLGVIQWGTERCTFRVDWPEAGHQLPPTVKQELEKS